MSFFVTGTDTDIGKTVVSAWLAIHLGSAYWKPVQSGLEIRDSETVSTLAKLSEDRIFPETFLLKEPLSPHEAARREGVTIRLDQFQLPETSLPLLVEGAGGIFVPLNEKNMMVDLMQKLAVSIILVCRSTLGTINHTLMSLEILRSRKLKIAGLVLVGPHMPHNEQALKEFGQVEIIGHLPPLDPLDYTSLKKIRPYFPLYPLPGLK